MHCFPTGEERRLRGFNKRIWNYEETVMWIDIKKTEANGQNTRAIVLPLGFTRNLEHAGTYTNVPSGWINVTWRKRFFQKVKIELSGRSPPCPQVQSTDVRVTPCSSHTSKMIKWTRTTKRRGLRWGRKDKSKREVVAFWLFRVSLRYSGDHQKA